jgi:hypothetical protein
MKDAKEHEAFLNELSLEASTLDHLAKANNPQNYGPCLCQFVPDLVSANELRNVDGVGPERLTGQCMMRYHCWPMFWRERWASTN